MATVYYGTYVYYLPGLKENCHQDLVLIGNSAQVVLSETYSC